MLEILSNRILSSDHCLLTCVISYLSLPQISVRQHYCDSVAFYSILQRSDRPCSVQDKWAFGLPVLSKMTNPIGPNSAWIYTNIILVVMLEAEEEAGNVIHLNINKVSHDSLISKLRKYSLDMIIIMWMYKWLKKITLKELSMTWCQPRGYLNWHAAGGPLPSK